MAPRIDVTKYPDALKAMYGLERIARERGIERKLLHLIKTRVSQINGCAYCIDMHTKDARAEGETEQRLYGLSAWQETPFYTPATSPTSSTPARVSTSPKRSWSA
jgi:AhpD family alkylhydroperoxidase